MCTAAAAWLSQGTIAFTGAGDARIALLPLSVEAWLAVAIAPAAVFAAWRRGASLAPLWLLALLVLPWLPPSLPAAFFVWSGPLGLDRVGGDRALARGVDAAARRLRSAARR